MNRYKLIFSYCGTSFNGYAKQIDTRTIQGEIEKTLSLILNEEINLYASGRTDKGVHAINQVAHFDATKDIELLEKFRYSLNKLIDSNIYFKSNYEIWNWVIVILFLIFIAYKGFSSHIKK